MCEDSTLQLDRLAVILCVCACVCVHALLCLFVWVCLTFNILTSYFKNVKLSKHVSLAGHPAAPSVSPLCSDTAFGWTDVSAFCTRFLLTTQLSKCQRNTNNNYNNNHKNKTTNMCRTFRWKFNNSGETLDVGSERFSVNGSRSILKYTPVTDQVNNYPDQLRHTFSIVVAIHIHTYVHTFTHKGTYIHIFLTYLQDYGTLSCWAANEVGTQQQPCLFQVVLAGKRTVAQPF